MSQLSRDESIIHDFDAFHEMQGINGSYSYVAMDGTSYPTHIEDASLYALNYMHKINKIAERSDIKGSKVWNVVAHSYQKDLEAAVKAAHKNSYSSPLRHKNTIVTPDFMTKNKIPFTTVYVLITFSYEIFLGLNIASI